MTRNLNSIVVAHALAGLVAVCGGGCVSRGAHLDPGVRWHEAELQQASVARALEDLRTLRSDYEAVIQLDHTGRSRGQCVDAPVV